MIGRPFQKGQSGNPSGRPRLERDIRDLARAHTTEAIAKLVHWMRSDDNPRASVAAAIALLDRAWGKPAQSLAVAMQPQNFVVIPEKMERNEFECFLIGRRGEKHPSPETLSKEEGEAYLKGCREYDQAQKRQNGNGSGQLN